MATAPSVKAFSINAGSPVSPKMIALARKMLAILANPENLC